MPTNIPYVKTATRRDMKKHVKIYMEYHGYGEQDIIMCEECNKNIAVEIHHIVFKSAGGGDNIENLIALCRECHGPYH